MNEIQTIQSKIYEIRGQRVMLDRDLAELYQVTTGNLNKAVKRNIRRFPPDFMFQLTKDEFNRLKSDLIFQNGTSNWGGTRKLPYAFTEQGLASQRAEVSPCYPDGTSIWSKNYLKPYPANGRKWTYIHRY